MCGVLQLKCADHDKDKELLSQQATQITGLENAKSWLERRLNETEVCFIQGSPSSLKVLKSAYILHVQIQGP